MGRPKLLLPFAGRTVIQHVLTTLAAPEITATIVVLHRDDEALREAVEQSGAVAVVPDEPPAEMIESIQQGLRFLEQDYALTTSDAWLLALADQPTIPPHVVRRLAERWTESDREILIPLSGGRRGHPVLFSGSLTKEVLRLPADQGLNQLVRRAEFKVEEVLVETPEVLVDLDTPEDYARVSRRVRE